MVLLSGRACSETGPQEKLPQGPDASLPVPNHLLTLALAPTLVWRNKNHPGLGSIPGGSRQEGVGGVTLQLGDAGVLRKVTSAAHEFRVGAAPP